MKGHVSRPLITVFPPRTSGGAPSSSRTHTFNFVDAVTTLPVALNDDNLAKIFQILGGHHPDQLRAVYVVLSDDDRERCQGLARAAQRNGRPSFASSGSGPRSGPSQAQTTSGVISGPGHGMDLTAGFLTSLRNPPPPPWAPAPRSRSRSRSPSIRKHRKVSPTPSGTAPSSRSRSPSVRKSRRSTSRSKGGLKRHRQSESRYRHRKSKKSKRSRRSASSSGSSSDGSSSRSRSKSSVRSKKH